MTTSMKKTFMGVRLRKLRAERGLSQAAMAQKLGLSASYLNQLEQNQRPLTVAVLLRIHRELGIDVQQFSEDEEARLIAGMREALADSAEAVSLPELQEVAAQMPAVGRALLALHRQRVEAGERLEALSLQLGDGRDGRADLAAPRTMPYEAVRDFFFARQNHVHELDTAAEDMAGQIARAATPAAEWLTRRLHQRHGVQVTMADGPGADKRRFQDEARVLTLSSRLTPSQQVFQLATQLALIEWHEAIAGLIENSILADAESRSLARVGLANYFAGALLLPYGRFLNQCEALRHDIDLLGHHFGVGYETVCHRLSTLQRPGSPGVPFFFVRVDRAGNISKRQSATHFHFSRTGGTCPLWNVYEAFAHPGEVLRQVAQMPDGRTYLWIARSVSSGGLGFGSPGKTFSIGLGCDVRHAPRLVYAKGLDLSDPSAATPIGMGCKVCERPDCPQRAFPFMGRTQPADENRSGFAPYGV
jgi:predicted transcriptional regulator/transcriptional regulator with XRE-family HTH domain